MFDGPMSKAKILNRLAAASVAAVTVATVAAVPAGAERLLVVGPSYPLPKLPVIEDITDSLYAQQAALVGSGYYPGADITIVDYPGGTWPVSGLDSSTVGQSVDAGAANLVDAIRAADGPVVVAGLSQGTMVLDAAQALMADDPDAPDADQVTFVVYGAPNHGTNGLLAQLPEGTYIPVFDLTVRRPVESQYDTVVVIGEYDGVADFPDRPWNPVAVLNSVFAMGVVHTPSAWSSPADVPPQNISVATNSRGATTTTYRLPTKTLPLVHPLKIAGVPDAIVEPLDRALRPVVDAGYSRHDAEPPDAARRSAAAERPGRLRDRLTANPSAGAASGGAGGGSEPRSRADKRVDGGNRHVLRTPARDADSSSQSAASSMSSS